MDFCIFELGSLWEETFCHSAEDGILYGSDFNSAESELFDFEQLQNLTKFRGYTEFPTFLLKSTNTENI